MTSASVCNNLAWIPDLHIDHLDVKNPGALSRLHLFLNQQEAGRVLLGGDIAESRILHSSLERLAGICRKPISFVLGNHDYYFGSVVDTRRIAGDALSADSGGWLPGEGIVNLGNGAALLGHGGWGDAGRGNLEDFIILTDFAAIADLAACIDRQDFWVDGFRKREKLVEMLQGLGREAALILMKSVNEAAGSFRQLIILTHVTPFYETSTYKGGPGGDKGFPCFVWEACRQPLLDCAASHPDTEFLVLSGHTHDESESRLAPNLKALSASAEYGELRCRMIRCLPESGRWEAGPSVTV